MQPTGREPSFFQRFVQLNWPLVLLITILGLTGIIMMISVGGGSFKTYALPQLIRFAVSFAIMLAVATIPLRVWFHYAYVVYFLLLLALIGVEVMGHIGMGAQRWLRLGGVNFQPSELAKIAIILALARYYHILALEDIRRFIALVIPVVMLGVPAVLILRQPNLGTTVITVGVGTIMLFMAGVRWRYFIGTALAGIAALPIAWQFLHDYQKKRVLTFLDPQQDPLGSGYNILQSMIAIGSGGLFGKGFMEGTQGQLNFLPEKHTDFIFTVLAEEWGFVGGVIVLGLYLMLLIAGLAIASSSRSSFGSLIAIGVTALLFLHVFINVAMVMGMLPVVGLPLPFLSYGGSIMLSTMIGMGLLLNADLHRNQQVTVSKEYT